MSWFQLHVNGKIYDVDADGEMPLLWLLRDILGLKGTKFGCGVAQCGACTVHLDGRAVRSCAVTAGVASLSKITTSRACRTTATTRSRRPGSSSACRNAGTANRARS